MNFVSRNMWAVYLFAGFLVGFWMGFKVQPALFQSSPPPSAEETARAQSIRENLERELAATLTQWENIVTASVHLTDSAASATLTFSNDGTRPEQAEVIAQQIASGVDGLHAGQVSIFDAKGTQLNRRAVQEHESKQFWTGIAINLAKVVGILAALVTIWAVPVAIIYAAVRAFKRIFRQLDEIQLDVRASHST